MSSSLVEVPERSAPQAKGGQSASRKLVFVANTAWYLYNFRLNLLRAVRDSGAEVVIVAPHDAYVKHLEAEGFRWVRWEVGRASMNPLTDSRSIVSLWDIYKQEAPDVVHHFTIKPILYGTVVAKRCGIGSIVNSVTGLGHLFTSRRMAAALTKPWIRRWYVWALTRPEVAPVFQNADDLQELSRHAPDLARRAVLTRGSGIDLTRFVSPENAALPHRTKRMLFVGRLLREKGIGEFVEAARLCREMGLPIELTACGDIDRGNPSSVSEQQLLQWQQELVVCFRGHVEAIEKEIQQADVVVLPSYREGTPRVLLEAAAMGKALIATDVPGCREVVTNGSTGVLVPPRDAPALADAMRLLTTDDSLREKLGTAAQRHVAAKFDELKVIAQTIRVYESLQHSENFRITPPATSNSAGSFVVSLDFELAWGTRGRPAARHVGPFLAGTRPAIKGLLKLCEEYEISATWAFVGGLLLGSSSGRKHAWLRGEPFADIPAGNCLTQPDWYAEDVIEWLAEHPVPQELGCHTLTHLYVKNNAAGRELVREELERFGELCAEMHLEQPRSFIYPKAMMAHVDLLAEAGYRCFRGPETGWFERLPGKTVPAGLRWADAVLSRPPEVQRPQMHASGIWMIPSSQFYSPFYSVGRRVSVAQRVRKAMKGLHLAAATDGVYHLWTHPFNLGIGTPELLAGVRTIFQEARNLAADGKLQIVSMGSLASQLDRIHGIALPENAASTHQLQGTTVSQHV